MLEKIPSEEEMTKLVGKKLLDVWNALCKVIDEKYDVEKTWNSGGKKWNYEYKYRRGGKTLCCLYAKESCVGFMIIFGRDERQKVDELKDVLSDSVWKKYDEAEVYHDGKWVMFEPCDATEFDDYLQLLAVKRKPNRR